MPESPRPHASPPPAARTKQTLRWRLGCSTLILLALGFVPLCGFIPRAASLLVRFAGVPTEGSIGSIEVERAPRDRYSGRRLASYYAAVTYTDYRDHAHTVRGAIHAPDEGRYRSRGTGPVRYNPLWPAHAVALSDLRSPVWLELVLLLPGLGLLGVGFLLTHRQWRLALRWLRVRRARRRGAGAPFPE